jgi:hypothetical protein
MLSAGFFCFPLTYEYQQLETEETGVTYQTKVGATMGQISPPYPPEPK